MSARWLILGGLVGCADTPADDAPWTEAERTLIQAMSPLPPLPPSPGNRVADDPAAAELGARLFADPGFSSNGDVACATCHDPSRHFTDGKRVAETSAGAGRRNTPSIETAPWLPWLFWDGRADSAWSQATGPIRNPIEHNFDAARVRERVLAVYASDWTPIFGPVADDPDRVLTEVGKAIEAFERTLSPGRSRFDQLADDLRTTGHSDALSPEEARGLRLFLGEANCVSCHNGPLFTDKSFHNLGLPGQAVHGVDVGRMLGATQVLADPFNCLGPHSDASLDPQQACAELRFLDPSFQDWAGAFKTPSLRNVAATAPYMHDGSFETLSAVLMFYNTMPGQPIIGHRELTLRPPLLDPEELAAIEAFLGTLSAIPGG